MKSIKTFPQSLLLLILLLLPWTVAEALQGFEQFGVIKALDYSSFTIRGQKYRISPGARLKSNDASRKRLSDFRAGDRIFFQGKILNGAYLVDLIVYETPIPS